MKSCGFVHFALPEDAQTAFENLTKKKFHGSLLQMEFARHRNRGDPKEAATASSPEKGFKAPSAEAKSEKPIFDVQKIKQTRQFNRTVIVTGVQHVDKKQLYKKVRKFGNISELIYPVETKFNPALAMENPGIG